MKPLWFFLICMSGILTYGAFKMFLSAEPNECTTNINTDFPENEYQEIRIGDTVVVAKIESANYRETHQSNIVSQSGEILFTMYSCDTATIAYETHKDLSESERLKLATEAALSEIPKNPDARYTLLSIFLKSENFEAVHNEIASYTDYRNFALVDALALRMLGRPVDITVTDLKPDDKMKLEYQILLIKAFIDWEKEQDKSMDDVTETILALIEKGWGETSDFYCYMCNVLIGYYFMN